MNKLKEYTCKIKYEACIFTALCMNFLLFFTKENIMSEAMYPIHLVDLKAGFISRTLTGTLNGLLFSHPTMQQTAAVHTAVTVTAFLVTAVFLGKCIRSADPESGKYLFVLSLGISVFPYGFMTFTNLFELLDIYWLLAAVMYLLTADSRRTLFIAPIFILLGGWAHYSFFLAFMPLIYIVFIRKLINEKSKLSYVFAVVTVIVSVSTTVYFFTTSRTFNVISFDEFTQYILDKAGDTITQFEVYCGEAFRPYDEIPYDYYIEKYNLAEWTRDASDLQRAIYGYFMFTFVDGSLTGLISNIILALPVAVLFAVLWRRAMKAAAGNRAEVFIYFLCLISPLIQLIAIFTSSDTSRWLSLMFISNFFMLAHLVKEGSEPVCLALKECFETVKKHRAIVVSAFLFYVSIVFVW